MLHTLLRPKCYKRVHYDQFGYTSQAMSLVKKKNSYCMTFPLEINQYKVMTITIIKT